MLKLIVIISVVIVDINPLVIPEDFVSFINLAYSFIPVVKKGTDSRLGWGFRLGNRVEIQMLWEFGPQTYTRPLGVQSDNNSNDKRRNIPDNLVNIPYSQKKRKNIQVSRHLSHQNVEIVIKLLLPERSWRSRKENMETKLAKMEMSSLHVNMLRINYLNKPTV